MWLCKLSRGLLEIAAAAPVLRTTGHDLGDHGACTALTRPSGITLVIDRTSVGMRLGDRADRARREAHPTMLAQLLARLGKGRIRSKVQDRKLQGSVANSRAGAPQRFRSRGAVAGSLRGTAALRNPSRSSRPPWSQRFTSARFGPGASEHSAPGFRRHQASAVSAPRALPPPPSAAESSPERRKILNRSGLSVGAPAQNGPIGPD